MQPKTQTAALETPQIPPNPVMSAEAAAYPKLLKIYKELNRQNGIIFDAERERNELELEHDSLKGLAKLTKKGKLQSRIDRKNEETDLLKVGLSGIVKRYKRTQTPAELSKGKCRQANEAVFKKYGQRGKIISSLSLLPFSSAFLFYTHMCMCFGMKIKLWVLVLYQVFGEVRQKVSYLLFLSCRNFMGRGLNTTDDSKDGIVKYLLRNPNTCFVAEDNGKLTCDKLSVFKG